MHHTHNHHRHHPPQDFSLKNPNRFRALIGAFANSNLAQFHAADGRGSKLVGDMVLAVDKINPQVRGRGWKEVGGLG